MRIFLSLWDFCPCILGKAKFKTLIFVIFATLIFFSLSAFALAEDVLSVEAVADGVDFSDLQAVIYEVEIYTKDLLDGDSLWEMCQSLMSGDVNFDLEFVKSALVNLFFSELDTGAKLLMQLILLSTFAMLLGNLSDSFDGGGAKLSSQVVQLVLILVASNAFLVAGAAAAEAIEVISDFMYAILPILLTLLASMGATSVVTLFNPAMLGVVTVAIHSLNVFFLPMSYVCAALTLTDCISTMKLSGLAGFLKNFTMGIFAIMLTLFTAFLGILGLGSATINGLTIKAAKSAAGIFIPVVGRTIADVMDSVIGTSLILKNGIGMFGMVVLLLICVVPAVKILILAIMFRLTSALTEPLGNKELADALGKMAGIITMFFAFVAVAGIFFFFLIGIVMAMGNISMAIR